jgi:hypothetical protein
MNFYLVHSWLCQRGNVQQMTGHLEAGEQETSEIQDI